MKKIRMLEFDREEDAGADNCIAATREFLGRRFLPRVDKVRQICLPLSRSENCRHVLRSPRVVFAFDADASITMLVYARTHSSEIAQQKAEQKKKTR